uniref:DC1 domain-containing protein n=1 Tax=Oryza punctata TaxID=4537 RepID=A0A0E0LN69_ORYPU
MTIRPAAGAGCPGGHGHVLNLVPARGECAACCLDCSIWHYRCGLCMFMLHIGCVSRPGGDAPAGARGCPTAGGGGGGGSPIVRFLFMVARQLAMNSIVNDITDTRGTNDQEPRRGTQSPSVHGGALGGRAVNARGPAAEHGEGAVGGAEEGIGGSGLQRRVRRPLELRGYDREAMSPRLRRAASGIKVVLPGRGVGGGTVDAPFPGDGSEVALLVIVILDLESRGEGKGAEPLLQF